jgi:quercetin 2,3-dioxygenase
VVNRFLVILPCEPFKEVILLWWNFVAHSPQEMVKATEDWNARRYFGAVKGSPLPRLGAPDPAGLNLKGVRK